jgi:hypothetical protein
MQLGITTLMELLTTPSGKYIIDTKRLKSRYGAVVRTQHKLALIKLTKLLNSKPDVALPSVLSTLAKATSTAPLPQKMRKINRFDMALELGVDTQLANNGEPKIQRPSLIAGHSAPALPINIHSCHRTAVFLLTLSQQWPMAAAHCRCLRRPAAPIIIKVKENEDMPIPAFPAELPINYENCMPKDLALQN